MFSDDLNVFFAILRFLKVFLAQSRKIIDKVGSGRSSEGSQSPSVHKPTSHMRDTINGQRATIAKLFEQGEGLFLLLLCFMVSSAGGLLELFTPVTVCTRSKELLEQYHDL